MTVRARRPRRLGLDHKAVASSTVDENPPGDATARVYDVAVEIVEMLRYGQCVSSVAIWDRLGVKRSTVQDARDYLRERGIQVEYVEQGRCWRLLLQEVDWRAVRLGDLVDLGVLPEDEEVLLAAAIGSQAEIGRLKARLLTY